MNDFRFCVELPIKAKLNKMILLNNIAHERARIGGIKKVNAFKDGFLILISMINYFIKKINSQQLLNFIKVLMGLAVEDRLEPQTLGL